MTIPLFILTISFVSAVYLFWGIRTLPAENRQFLAAVPVSRDGLVWKGVNLTWYGLLTANSYVAAVAIAFVLLGAAGVPLIGTILLSASLLFICVPASRLVARVVENKRHTFTVGGAVFTGVVVSPLLIPLLNATAGELLGFHIRPAAALAALAIAYAFGEGFGRLACISFGCCYGKPLDASPNWLRRLFAGRGFVFRGATRKVAYAGGLEGVQVLPIQGVTAVVYVAVGIGAAWLYLADHSAAAFTLALTVTQLWRVVSEVFRDDFRGEGKVSAYQVMGLIAVAYGVAAMKLASEGGITPVLGLGLDVVATLPALLSLQLLWGGIFVYTGRSTVTGAMMTFHVHPDRL